MTPCWCVRCFELWRGTTDEGGRRRQMSDRMPVRLDVGSGAAPDIRRMSRKRPQLDAFVLLMDHQPSSLRSSCKSEGIIRNNKTHGTESLKRGLNGRSQTQGAECGETEGVPVKRKSQLLSQDAMRTNSLAAASFTSKAPHGSMPIRQDCSDSRPDRRARAPRRSVSARRRRAPRLDDL